MREQNKAACKPRRKTFLKAFQEEEKNWRWATMTADKEALVVAFCACVYLRMQGTSMDEVMGKQSPKHPNKL